MKQPKPKPRVNSDSLIRESNRKKYFAYEQERIAKGQIKRDGGNEPLRYRDANQRVAGPSGNERMQIVKKARQSASKDSLTAVQSKRMKSTKPAPAKSVKKSASKSVAVKKAPLKSTKK